jgi:transposase
MPTAYSIDLRERVVAMVEGGASRRETAEQFGLSPSVVVLWMQRYATTGNVAAKPTGGSVSPLDAHEEFILGLIEERPDMTLDEIVEAMTEVKIPGSRTAVWRFFDRHGITVKKKTLYADEQKRADCARTRRRWHRVQGFFHPARLVFIDETSTSTSMVRQYARGPRGERVIGYAPEGHRKTMTFIAGLRQRGMTAPGVIDGAMNGPMFVGYLEQILAPTLKRGDIVIMDNASVHKVAGVREAIEAAGACLLYLPPYSPDLNPIEMAFSKLKALLRKAAERTVPGLIRLIGRLMKAFSREECKNFLRHAGYEA